MKNPEPGAGLFHRRGQQDSPTPSPPLWFGSVEATEAPLPESQMLRGSCPRAQLHLCRSDTLSGPLCQGLCAHKLFKSSPPNPLLIHPSPRDRTHWPQLPWQPGNHGSCLWHSWPRLIGSAGRRSARSSLTLVPPSGTEVLPAAIYKNQTGPWLPKNVLILFWCLSGNCCLPAILFIVWLVQVEHKASNFTLKQIELFYDLTNLFQHVKSLKKNKIPLESTKMYKSQRKKLVLHLSTCSFAANLLNLNILDEEIW